MNPVQFSCLMSALTLVVFAVCFVVGYVLVKRDNATQSRLDRREAQRNETYTRILNR